MRVSLKGRLPWRLFKLKAQQLYGDWLVQNPTTEDQRLKLTNKWIKQWENEYGLSSKKTKQTLLNQEGGPSYTTTRLFEKYLDSSQVFYTKVRH